MTNNTALITVSYGGLGTCFVNIHAGKGGDLILVGRNQEMLDAQAKEMTDKYHITAHTISVDLSSPDAAQQIYDTCKSNNCQVDFLINNAGFGGQGDFNLIMKIMRRNAFENCIVFRRILLLLSKTAALVHHRRKQQSQ